MNNIVKYYPFLLQKARKYAKIICIKAMKGRKLMSKKTTLAVIGVGNMASAIIGGILSSDSATGITGDSLVLYNRTPEKAEKFAKDGAFIAKNAAEAAEKGDYILLAVKPQNIPDLLADIAKIDMTGKVFISICAGISSEIICVKLGREVPVVRVMPNTPLQIGLGVSAIARNNLVEDADYEKICGIFEASGMVLRLKEDQIDAVTSVNGSSPAYFYYFIDAVMKSAEAQGLHCENLLEAICKTAIGSAEMLMRSGKTPAELIRAVTSPHGTTEQAMNVFYKADTAATIDEAMRACTRRAAEMAKEAAEK